MKKRILFIFIIVFLVFSLVIIFNNSSSFKVVDCSNKISYAKKKYSDYPVIGWIRVQGTNIDYFLMGNTDNYPVEIEKYAWVETKDNKFHNVMNIFGHNVMNLGGNPSKQDELFTRFEEIVSFLYYDVAKSNKYIQININNKNYVYQIFAVGITNNYYLYTLPIGEYTKKQKENYLKIVEENSIYDYNVKRGLDDDYITLITCTRFFGNTNHSIYVSAKRVNKTLYSNYSVKKNDNYKKIDNKLKGDEND